MDTNGQMILKDWYNTERLQFIWKQLYFYFSYLYLSLAGNIIVHTPDQGTKWEKYFNLNIYQKRDADSGGKQTPFHPFLSSRTASFPPFGRKKYGPIRRNWTWKCLFLRRHNKWKHKQKIKDISIRGINTIIQVKKLSKIWRNEVYIIKRFMITCCINSNHCLEQTRRIS